MTTTVQAFLADYFAERFLVFDREAAESYATLASRGSARGYPISVADCQIAAIAAAHGFTVATRDTAPFKAAGVPVINPWAV
jgi:predicted nucleic acid-binding protein